MAGEFGGRSLFPCQRLTPEQIGNCRLLDVGDNQIFDTIHIGSKSTNQDDDDDGGGRDYDGHDDDNEFPETRYW